MHQRRMLFKSIQRRIYDLLLTRTGVCAMLGGLLVVLVCVLQLSDTIIEYRLEQLRRLANVITLQNASISLSINYNYKQPSFGQQQQSDQTSSSVDYWNEPIDVVYTWVNGSDPAHLASMRAFRNSSYSARLVEASEYLDEHDDNNNNNDDVVVAASASRLPCYHKLCVQTGRVVVSVPGLDQVTRKSLLAKTPLVQLEHHANFTVIYLTNRTQLAQIHSTLSGKLR